MTYGRGRNSRTPGTAITTIAGLVQLETGEHWWLFLAAAPRAHKVQSFVSVNSLTSGHQDCGQVYQQTQSIRNQPGLAEAEINFVLNQIASSMAGWMMDGWMAGWMDGWMDG